MDNQTGEDTVFGNLNRLIETLSELDERGIILALAAFAEEALGDLIEAFLVPGDPAKQLLKGFNAPPGTLSARIKTAFCLGLITKRQYSDLEHLRHIRNVFAHTWEQITFENQKVASHIKALHFSSLGDDYPSAPVEKVRSSFGSLLVELRSTTNQINIQGRQARLIGGHLIAGVAGPLDEQISLCRTRLVQIDEDLRSADGERRRFLKQLRHNWEGKLEIVRRNAPKDRQVEIRAVQADLKAWNIPPE